MLEAPELAILDECMQVVGNTVTAAQQEVQPASGGNVAKDNSCGGGVLLCGPLLAQKGAVSIALCSSTKQCMGCGALATVMDGVTSKCMVDGGMGGANGTIDDKQELSYEVDFVVSNLA